MTRTASPYLTTWPRAIFAFFMLVFVMTAPFQAIYIRDILLHLEFATWVEHFEMKFSLWFFPSVFLAGSIFVALLILPVWIVMHIRGSNHAWHAAVAGFLIPAATVALYFLPESLNHGFEWPDSFFQLAIAPALMGSVSMVSALIAWRIAYRQVPVEGA